MECKQMPREINKNLFNYYKILGKYEQNINIIIYKS